MTVDKHALLETLRAKIKDELDRSTSRARDAAEAATHEENKPEGDKDMRSTEASYIARGQAERVRDLEQSLLKLASIHVHDFEPGAKIETSALVDVTAGKKTTTYFLVPAGGGIKLGDILSLATTSPLGLAILGREEGDETEVSTPQGVRTYEIAAVR